MTGARRPAERPRALGAILWVATALVTANATWHGATAEVADPDGWWVAAAGRRMLSGALPRTNGWSFTAPDHPWVMHEWLLGPLYGWGATHGSLFFSALSALFGLALIATVFAGSGTRSAPVLPRLLATAFYGGLFGLASAFSRPTTAGLLLAGFMAALATRPRFGWREGALALVVQLAWTNAHGSFPLGCALLGWSALAFAEDRRARGMAAALSVAVTFVNPYGPALHELVLAYATGGAGGLGWARQMLLEFQPLWGAGWRFVHPSELVGLVLLALLAVAHGARPGSTPRREALARSTLTLALIAFASLQARHATLAGLVGTIALAPAFGSLLRGSVSFGPGMALAALVPATVVGLLGLALAGGQPSAKTGGAALPELARAVPDGAAVFVPFHQAGRFVWETDPRGVRVFYDSRNDCYPLAVVREGWAVEHEGDLEPLDARGAEWALTRAGTLLDDALGAARAWSLFRARGEGRLYRRASAATARGSALRR